PVLVVQLYAYLLPLVVLTCYFGLMRLVRSVVQANLWDEGMARISVSPPTLGPDRVGIRPGASWTLPDPFIIPLTPVAHCSPQIAPSLDGTRRLVLLSRDTHR